MRTQKAILNSVTALLLELITIICGFILPRMILSTFGSKYNGITSSISQFLSYIALLKSGIGGVTRASLYKPLKEHDKDGISAIIIATEKYMRQIAKIFAAVIFLFAIVYPFAISRDFPWFFSFSLVLILGLGTFFQYYFGMTYQMLLQADQRQYISSCIQIATTIVNTIVAVILIKADCSIHVVKLGSAIVFTLNPLLLYFYVRKTYEINRHVKPNMSAISQRWDSFAHQVANFVHGNTDIVILTIFASLTEVSIYSVYAMIVTGVKKLVNSLASGMEAAFGNMLAKGEDKLLHKNLKILEFVIYNVGGVCFSCAMVLIVPFVQVYTSGVHDANYVQPTFGVLLCLAEFLWCIRIPYQSVVLAAGKFKDTRNGAIAEPIINICISVILVFRYGIIGVAVGTIVAMAFRTIQYAIYMSTKIVKRSLSFYVKNIILTTIKVLSACALSQLIRFSCEGYIDWIYLALYRSFIIFGIYIIFIGLFEREDFVLLYDKVKRIKK